MIDTQELADVVEETLEGLSETLVTGPVSLPADISTELIHASVDIELAAPAAFSLVTSVATGLTLSAWLTRLDVADLTTADACDTMSEICNLLAGSAKTVLDDETQLSTPTVRLVPSMPELPGCLWTPVPHRLGIFNVALHELSEQLAG